MIDPVACIIFTGDIVSAILLIVVLAFGITLGVGIEYVYLRKKYYPLLGYLEASRTLSMNEEKYDKEQP